MALGYLNRHVSVKSGDQGQVPGHWTALSRLAVLTVFITSVVISLAWQFPLFAELLPPEWSQMKANTAFSFMVTSFGLGLLCRFRRLPPIVLILSALVVLSLAGSSLLGHLLGQGTPLDTLLAADAQSTHPGRMSLPTAAFFAAAALYGISRGVFLWPKMAGLHRGWVQTAYWSVMFFTSFTLLSYLFKATQFYVHDADTLTSPHTLMGMVLLITTITTLEIKWGTLRWLAGPEAGSAFLRYILPVICVLPIATVGVGNYLIAGEGLPASMISTIEVLIFAATFTYVCHRMAARINAAEKQLADLALTDELTGVYNRRAFYTLGNHLFAEASRDNYPLTVVFFDIDGLKPVNDSLGHETGSRLIAEFAGLLSATFRQCDIVARVGGDEFAVLSRNDHLVQAVSRFANAVEVANSKSNRDYDIKYSYGQVVADPQQHNSFEHIVSIADTMMFDQKRRKSSSVGKKNEESKVVAISEPKRRSAKGRKGVLEHS